MKQKTSRLIKTTRILTLLLFPILLMNCQNDDPMKEDTPELITKATLTFTPTDGGTPVTATASDPDGEGVQDIVIDGPINLGTNKTYLLSVQLVNQLVDPSDPAYDITKEVEKEGSEHLFFYAWTNDTFSDPTGNGNVDNRSDKVNYNDQDEMGLPIGISTTWTTSGSPASGTFRIVLKHQHHQKSATSDVTMGESDLDLTFALHVN